MKKTIICLAGALILTTTSVWAAPSVNGSTGTINNPTADTLREGQFSLGYYNLKDGDARIFNMNVAPNVEVGVVGFNYDNSSSETILNAKVGLMSEKILRPGLAIGVEDINDKNERTAYAVASKGLPLGFRMHVGVGNGRYDGVFAGIEKTIKPLGLGSANFFPTTTLIAEYDGKDMNYGARMSVIPGLKMDAGWRNHDFYVGLTFTK